MRRPARRAPAALLALSGRSRSCSGGCGPALAARPLIHAHRGGSLEFGKPAYPENTLPAFRHARVAGVRAGAGREAHERPRAGGDPRRHARPDHAVHGERGRPHLRSAPRRLPLGHPRHQRPLRAAGARRPAAARRSPSSPRCSRWPRRTGARLNLEIKNLPTDPDFDATPGYANTVIDAIEASHFPHSRLIVQSFWPPNLIVVKSRLPDVETSFLSLGSSLGTSTAPAPRATSGSRRVAAHPEYIAKAHAAGLRVVPYTIDTAAEWPPPPGGRGRADHQRPRCWPVAPRPQVEGPAPAIPPPPSRSAWAAARASRSIGTIEARGSRRHGLRVFAMQLKQEVRHVETYASLPAPRSSA